MEIHNPLAKDIVDCSFQIHNQLHPGLLATVYGAALTHGLQNHGLSVDRQREKLFEYNGIHLEEGFRAYQTVDGKIILEIKLVE